MNCNAARGLLSAYLDGELDLVRHLEVEHHIQECAGCAEEQERQRSLHRAVTTQAPYYRAPAGLRERLQSTSDRPRATSKRLRWGMGVAVAAGIALVAVLIGRIGSGPNAEDRMAEEVVASHVRSRMADHLIDMPSSDQHVVKPWLTRNLDFAPAVLDLSGEGFLLAGGRLDYLDGQPVAALVYRRREHVINLFVTPSSEAHAERRSLARRGFHLVHWSHGGMRYWAVTDLNERELAEFAGLVQDHERRAKPQ